jgi:hypothetical protein
VAPVERDVAEHYVVHAARHLTAHRHCVPAE